MEENSNYANAGLGEITAEQLEASRHDPRVIALHAQVDKHRIALRAEENKRLRNC